RGVLHRLLRHAAGIRLHGQARLPLSRPALFVAKASPRNAGARGGAGEIHLLPAEPRSSGKLAERRADALPAADSAAAARPADADVVSGRGVRGVRAVPLL